MNGTGEKWKKGLPARCLLGGEHPVEGMPWPKLMNKNRCGVLPLSAAKLEIYGNRTLVRQLSANANLRQHSRLIVDRSETIRLVSMTSLREAASVNRRVRSPG